MVDVSVGAKLILVAILVFDCKHACFTHGRPPVASREANYRTAGAAASELFSPASRVSLDRIGEGLKPLTSRYTPTENSKIATGSAASAATGAVGPKRPNSLAASEARSRGAPMNAIKGR